MKKLLFLLPLAVLACKKTEDIRVENNPNPTIADAPSIGFVGVNKSMVREYEDTIIFRISYQDGNGDLGFSDADSMSITIKDSRDTNNLVFEYPLAPLAPAGTDIAIQGEFSIYLQNPVRVNSQAPAETTRFYISLRDRANNRSNTVVSNDITIFP